MVQQRKIFFAIPTYSGEIDHSTHLSIVRAMGEAGQRGWTTETVFRNWDSVISRARNVLFSMFLNTDCTDLFFIDGDIGCRPGSITRLLEHNVDIVGGAYRGRSDKDDWVLRTTASGRLQFDATTKLMEVEAIATGFMRITRDAGEKIAAAFSDDWYMDCTAPADMKVYNLFDFTFDREHRLYWSEDYTFCRRWRDQCGGQIWLDPMLEIDHTGKKVWTGCFYDYLSQHCREPQPSAPPLTLLSAAKALVAAAPSMEAAA